MFAEFYSPLQRNIIQDERICQKAVCLKKILQIRLRYFSNSSSRSDDEEGVLAGSDQDDEEKTRENNEPPKQTSNKQPRDSNPQPLSS